MTFEIRPQNLEEALAQVERLKKRLPWYQEHGYKVSVPEDTSPEAIQKIMDASVEMLQRAADAIEAERGTIEACAARVSALPWARLPERCLVLLSRFGVGGSYRVEEGAIILKVRDDGTLVNPPAQAVVHELVHLAVQKSLVEAHDLTQNEKEGLVDGICLALLSDVLPGYEAQERSDKTMLDLVAAHVEKDLLSAIARYKS